MLYLVLTNGLLDSLNPCAIGVLILYLGILLSFKTNYKLLLLFGLFYIISIYATYFFIGLGLLKTFHLFGVHSFFGWAAAIVILFFGLHNLKEYFYPYWQIPIITPFLSRCRIPKFTNNISIVSAIVLGFFVGLCEFPCSGAIYLATVALLTIKSTFFIGLVYLIIYNLMFVVPLIIIFIFVGNSKFYNWLQKAQAKNFSKIKLIMGIAMTLSGISLLYWLISSIM